jgi:hypothetical protein
MAADFVKSCKGGEFLIVDMYLYRIDRNVPPIRRWKCKTNGCRATAKTDGIQLVCASDPTMHQHCNDEVAIGHLRFRNTVKDTVSTIFL